MCLLLWVGVCKRVGIETGMCGGVPQQRGNAGRMKKGRALAMMSNGFDYDPLYVKLRMREMQAEAEEARRARQARQARQAHGPRLLRLRHHVGTLLIRAGEALLCQPVATPGPEGAKTTG